MNDTTKMAVAAAVAGGYVLGRTRKAKFALGVATYLAGRRMGVSPQQLLTEGLHRLAESPQFIQLGEQIRGGLRDAGRARLDSFADVLHERTELLRSLPEEPSDEEEEFEEEEPEEEEEEEGGRGKPSARGVPRASSTKRPPAAEKAPAKKTAAKKAAKKSAAKKSAPAKKTAKKTAAKKTSARPGRGR